MLTHNSDFFSLESDRDFYQKVLLRWANSEFLLFIQIFYDMHSDDGRSVSGPRPLTCGVPKQRHPV